VSKIWGKHVLGILFYDLQWLVISLMEQALSAVSRVLDLRHLSENQNILEVCMFDSECKMVK
jgi:hypothetical protein